MPTLKQDDLCSIRFKQGYLKINRSHLNSIASKTLSKSNFRSCKFIN